MAEGGGEPVNAQAVMLTPGARLIYDGDLVEVVEFRGAQAVVRNARTAGFVTVTLSRLAAGARPAESPAVPVGPPSLAVAWDGLTVAQRAVVSERAAHVREVLTGYRAGHAGAAVPGEPRPPYGPGQPLKARYQAKATELGVGERTVERWAMAYRESGEAGLVDTRMLRGRLTAVDPRWDQAVRLVLAEMVSDSTPTRSAVLRKVGARLDELHGEGVVPRPSTATAYRRLGELAKGTNAVSGSAKGRRSIADRPKGAYGRLRAMRPGEYAILDTQDLDVFAMEPVTCRWVRTQLTIIQDLFTRSVTGLRVTPVSTKAVDVAGILYQAVVPQPAPADWPEEACWAYHGVPQHLVFTEDGRLPGVPVCPPETLVVDHGKVYVSEHITSVCPAHGHLDPAGEAAHGPWTRGPVERYFRTLREGLLQWLPAYKGPDVHSRGLDLRKGRRSSSAYELEQIIREWTALRVSPQNRQTTDWPTRRCRARTVPERDV